MGGCGGVVVGGAVELCYSYDAEELAPGGPEHAETGAEGIWVQLGYVPELFVRVLGLGRDYILGWWQLGCCVVLGCRDWTDGGMGEEEGEALP